MNSDASSQPSGWISAYLDGTISDGDFASLNMWLKSSSENTRSFAAMVMLDDRLRSEFAINLKDGSDHPDVRKLPPFTAPSARSDETASFGGWNGSRNRVLRSVLPLVSTALLAIIGAVVFLQSFGGNRVSAAVMELERLIEKSVVALDHTYRIRVETSASPPRTRRPNRGEERRPPKPPLNDAILYVREGGRFTLVRMTEQGRFITGCNGHVSWMIDSSGFARTDSNPEHFNRDVPGHEHQLSLINIHDSLEHLKKSYDVQLLPEEPAADGDVETRLLVAIRHRKERGPRRVEITYEVTSGSIRQIRFIEMPYGPDLLNVEMTLTSVEPLSADFFEYAHHEQK
ncbi:MAG: hypothetical protein ACK58L_18150 [Planctomycetota bacterium]